jgi:hypothetical protein
MANAILIFIVWSGILLMVVGWYRNKYKCSPPIVEYRYVARTFKEEQEEPVNMEDLFSNMFKDPNPWPYSTGYRVEDDILKSERINN